MSNPHVHAEQTELALGWTDRSTSGGSSPTHGSAESLERIVADLLPADSSPPT